MSTINDSGNLIPRIYSFLYLSDEEVAEDTKPRSNRNPILRDFRYDSEIRTLDRRVDWAEYWAGKLSAPDDLTEIWRQGATVSEQVFAARVLYRYAAVFGS